MKRSTTLLIAAGAGAIALAASLFWGRALLGQNPVSSRQALSFPDGVLADGDNLYLTVNSSRQVLKLDREGHVLCEIAGGGEPGKGFSQAWMMAVDGDLYLFDSRANTEDFNIQNEHILCYGVTGIFDRSVLSIDYGADRPTSSRILSFEVHGGVLTWLYRMGAAESAIYRQDLATGRKEEVARIPVGDDMGDITSLVEWPLLWTTKRGAIWRMEKGGSAEALQLPADVVYPDRIKRLKDGRILFADVAKASIMAFLPDGSVSTFADAASLSRSGYTHRTVLFERFDQMGDGSVVALDAVNRTLLFLSSDGQLKSSVDTISWPALRTVLRLLYWLQIPLLILLLILVARILFVDFLRRRFPLGLKQLVIYIPLLVLFSVVISFTVSRDANRHYREGMQNRLLGMAQVLSKSVDGDVLDRISLPGDFQGEDYVAIQSKLLGLLNNAGDSWNADLSFVIYRNYGGIFYYIVTMWDYIGTRYPTVYVSDSHERAWTKGEIALAEYTDPDSEWLSAIAPVRDSAGRISGILEVYVDKLPIDKKEREARQKLVLQTVAAILGFGLAIAIATLFLLRMMRRLTQSIDRASRGDLSVVASIDSRDELGDISASFDGLMRSLGELVSGVRKNLDDLSGAGDILADHMLHNEDKTGAINRRIAESKEGIAERAQVLRASLASIEQVGEGIGKLDLLILRQEDALKAAFREVESLAAESRTAADRSSSSADIVGELVSAAETGRGLQDEVSLAVREVSEQSAGLAELNNVIASIADQTNLLAMNAAIEAAHAGEAGRGFAVVADEVRKLSEETARQSLEIQDKLEALMGRIASFNGITAQTSRAFSSIQGRVAEVAGVVAELKTAALNNAVASAKIRASLAEVLDAARGAAAGASGMKAGSEGLGKLIGDIETMIEIVNRNLDEITLQAGSIDEAARSSAELTERNRESIRAVAKQLDRFTV